MGRRTLLMIISLLVATAGVALVGLWVSGAEQRAQTRWALVRVPATARRINPGEPGVFHTILMPKASVPPDLDYEATKGVLRATETLYPNTVPQKGMFSAEGAATYPADGTNGMCWRAVQLGTGGLPSETTSGSRVDVVLAYPDTGKAVNVLSGVKVTRIGGQKTRVASPQTGSSNVTLEVPCGDAEKLAAAGTQGEITLTLLIGST